VDELQSEFPGLKRFSTLSPIPGFANWVRNTLESGETLLNEDDSNALGELFETGDGDRALLQVFDNADWSKEADKVELLEPVLTRLCGRYLLKEKNDRGRARDPVAHFHLTNGAQVERLNWMADTSSHGFSQSAGMMVNYLYNLTRIEANHEGYTGDGKVAASTVVNRILKK